MPDGSQRFEWVRLYAPKSSTGHRLPEWAQPWKESKQHERFKGVFYRKDTGYWRSMIGVDGERINLGSNFGSAIDAARCFDTAATKYHKEFARLNFPLVATAD